jgi:hypothetical protein
VSDISPPTPPNILGKFASIVTLLGAALYFTGWIYRWAYFSFFQLEVTTLDLPFESFLMVPLQVFLGDPFRCLLTILTGTFTAILIYIILKLLKKQRWIKIDFNDSFIDELVIVSVILIILFWLARFQGTADARRDAGLQSTLPAVTVVTPEKRLGIGRKLGSTDNPAGFRVIGDAKRYNQLIGRELNDQDNKRVWRLLIDRNGFFYLFRSLPPNANSKERPTIVIIQGSTNGDHVLILSPDVSKEEN